MSDDREVERARLDALMYRMLGGLLLLGAGVLLVVVLLLLGLPQREAMDGHVLVLPGMEGRHAISATALPVLGAGVLALGVPGALALALGRSKVRFGRERGVQIQPRSARRPLLILLGGLALLAIVLLRR